MPQHDQPVLKPLISVLDFGAVPDGVTDNSEAFQNAIAFAADGSAVVAVPPGIYRLGKEIDLSNSRKG